MSIKNSDGETIAVSQEGTLAIEDFLKDNYLFRRNVLNGKVEFATLPADEPVYRVLTQQALNSIIIRAKREAVVEKGSPKSEIMELVNSEEVPVYDPIREYLDSLPQWDGRNHVAQLFSRLPGISTEQHGFLAVWLRSAVAHWLQMDILHGNECVPTLIGAQGCGKTTFVTRLLPSHLRQYFLDHLNLSNKFDKEMALTNNLLVNLDELDAIRPSQHPALKQTLSKSKVNGRPIFGCSSLKKGGVKEVLMKHLLPLNPFVHRHFRHIGGGEEVFLQNPQKKDCISTRLVIDFCFLSKNRFTIFVASKN